MNKLRFTVNAHISRSGELVSMEVKCARFCSGNPQFSEALGGFTGVRDSLRSMEEMLLAIRLKIKQEMESPYDE